MALRCSRCGMPMPLFGELCPYCRSPRGDEDIQVRAAGGVGGLLPAGVLAFFLGFDIGGILIAAFVGGVIGAIFPTLFARLLVLEIAVVVLGGVIVPALVFIVIPALSPPKTQPNPQPTPVQPVVSPAPIDVKTRVRLGMTPSEVRAEVGPPVSEISTPNALDTPVDVWIYATGRVHFRNSRVVQVD